MQLHIRLIILFISFCMCRITNLYYLLFMDKRRKIPRLDITFKVVEIKYTNVWQYISSFERQICCWLMVFYIIASSFLLRQGKQNSLVVAFFSPIAHTPCSCFNINLIRIIYECILLSEISFLNVKFWKSLGHLTLFKSSQSLVYYPYQ